MASKKDIYERTIRMLVCERYPKNKPRMSTIKEALKALGYSDINSNKMTWISDNIDAIVAKIEENRRRAGAKARDRLVYQHYKFVEVQDDSESLLRELHNPTLCVTNPNRAGKTRPDQSKVRWALLCGSMDSTGSVKCPICKVRYKEEFMHAAHISKDRKFLADGEQERQILLCKSCHANSHNGLLKIELNDQEIVVSGVNKKTHIAIVYKQLESSA